MRRVNSKYLFGSRILTHVLFWLVYYVTFSLLWVKDGNYHQSFGLEFVLMPIRITASYITIYLLIPRYLLTRQVIKFVFSLLLLLLLGGVIQRIFTFYFYEWFFMSSQVDIWNIRMIIRSMVLINSTVLLLSAVKMYDYWMEENEKSIGSNETFLVIRSDKRNFKVKPSEIYYVEGLGNYATLYLEDKKPMITYLTLKDLEEILPDQFVRVHKSFIVNKDHIRSYTAENLEVFNRMIPIGKSVEIDF